MTVLDAVFGFGQIFFGFSVLDDCSTDLRFIMGPLLFLARDQSGQSQAGKMANSQSEYRICFILSTGTASDIILVFIDL